MRQELKLSVDEIDKGDLRKVAAAVATQVHSGETPEQQMNNKHFVEGFAYCLGIFAGSRVLPAVLTDRDLNRTLSSFILKAILAHGGEEMSVQQEAI